jgi:hypothetical protein
VFYRYFAGTVAERLMNVKTRFYKKNRVFAKSIMLEILSLFIWGAALIVVPFSPDGPRKKTFHDDRGRDR